MSVPLTRTVCSVSMLVHFEIRGYHLKCNMPSRAKNRRPPVKVLLKPNLVLRQPAGAHSGPFPATYSSIQRRTAATEHVLMPGFTFGLSFISYLNFRLVQVWGVFCCFVCFLFWWYGFYLRVEGKNILWLYKEQWFLVIPFERVSGLPSDSFLILTNH